MIALPVDPVAKPRMTRQDKWKQRKCVMKYRAYKDELNLRLKPYGEIDLNFSGIRFVIPMPKSWSQKKRDEMNGQPHTQKPDVDNLLKGLMDALMEDDSGVHTVSIQKVWGEEGGITIRLEKTADELIAI